MKDCAFLVVDSDASMSNCGMINSSSAADATIALCMAHCRFNCALRGWFRMASAESKRGSTCGSVSAWRNLKMASRAALSPLPALHATRLLGASSLRIRERKEENHVHVQMLQMWMMHESHMRCVGIGDEPQYAALACLFQSTSRCASLEYRTM